MKTQLQTAAKETQYRLTPSRAQRVLTQALRDFLESPLPVLYMFGPGVLPPPPTPPPLCLLNEVSLFGLEG